MWIAEAAVSPRKSGTKRAGAVSRSGCGSRVARGDETLVAAERRMEAGVSSVTLDRMIRALTTLGVSRATIVKALGNAA